MGVGSFGEQRQERFDDRIAPRQPVAARALQRGRADFERHLEGGGVLAGDTVAAGRQSHRIEERHVRIVRDVLLVDAAKPAW